MSVSTRSEAMRDAIKDAETWANEKEEKDNDSQVIERGTIKGVEYFIEKVTETVKYPRPFEQVRYVGKLKKDGRVVNYTPRHERIDTCKRALEELAKEYKENSAEEKDNSLIGLFDDLRPKDEKTVKEYIRQVKNFIRQCEAKSERSDYAKDYRDLNKRAAESYKKDVEKAERWLSEHRNSDEEKGYYAKLAEEKASRKH
jgi:hypothetical protein